MVARRAAAKAAQSEADDRLLVEAAQKDPSRFGDLYEVNFARVYAFVASRVHDRDAAQDLTSDVFHKALANLSRFEWRAYHSRPGFCGSRPTRLPIEPSELPERFPVPKTRQSRAPKSI